MCKAMNRSHLERGLRRLRRDARGRRGRPRWRAPEGEVRSTSWTSWSSCADAKEVIIVPGYGMAVAQAQHAVDDFARALQGRGIAGALRDPPGRRAPARAT
jgi:NAD(P) transhydrogenase subunit beta